MTDRSFDVWRFIGKTCFFAALVAAIGWAYQLEEHGLSLVLTSISSIWLWEQL